MAKKNFLIKKNEYSVIFVSYVRSSPCFSCFRWAALCLLVILLFVGCSSPTSSNSKRPQIIVDADITEDTVWESGKDYIVKGLIFVHENALLKVQSGACIYFSKSENEIPGRIVVSGQLKCLGQDSINCIELLCSDNDINKNNYLIEFEDSKGIQLFNFCKFNKMDKVISNTRSQMTISSCTFIECKNIFNNYKTGSVLIEFSNFIRCSEAVNIDLSPQTEDSEIKIMNNDFEDCSDNCVFINYSNVYIQNNIFSNCETGICINYFSAVDMLHNLFDHLDMSLTFTKSTGNVIYNKFTNGIHFILFEVNSDPSVNYNNFLNCTKGKILLGKNCNKKINLRYNWWNTDKIEEIMQTIENSSGNYNNIDEVILIEPFSEKYVENNNSVSYMVNQND
ncbi:right-handed parallel beta-helix repeat-containing protein [bacterium]|nr:right-handed parallel beta-helix repeat-containing protein [bacterium]